MDRKPTVAEAEGLKRTLNSSGDTEVDISDGEISKLSKKGGTARMSRGLGGGLVKPMRRLRKAHDAYGVIAILFEIGDTELPDLSPSGIMQSYFEKRVKNTVRLAMQRLEIDFPSADDVAPSATTARQTYAKAKRLLDDNEKFWVEVVKRGVVSDQRRIEQHLNTAYKYYRVLEARDHIFLSNNDKLSEIVEEIDTLMSAYSKLSKELEDKTELALKMPGGYPISLGLFDFSRWFRDIAQLLNPLRQAVTDKQLEYRDASEECDLVRAEIVSLAGKWEDIFPGAPKEGRFLLPLAPREPQ